MSVSASTLLKLRSYRDPGLVRLRCGETGGFLHLSGAGVVRGTDWAWLGTLAQAAHLERDARARGENWPFAVEAREKDEPVGSIDAW